MKKTLLILFCAAASMAVSAQTPYLGIPYPGTDYNPDSAAHLMWKFDAYDSNSDGTPDADQSGFGVVCNQANNHGSNVPGKVRAAVDQLDDNAGTNFIDTRAGSGYIYLHSPNDFYRYTISILESRNYAVKMNLNNLGTADRKYKFNLYKLNTGTTPPTADFATPTLSSPEILVNAMAVVDFGNFTIDAGKYVIEFVTLTQGAIPELVSFEVVKNIGTALTANTFKANMFFSNNVLNISGNEGVSTVSVYDISGKQMMVTTVSSASVQLPLNLKSGLYVVSLASANGTMTQKVVVK
jgi:hypothetical protein